MPTIRNAVAGDAALISQLIGELAEFEKAPEKVRTTAADIARDGFGANPQFRALIAESDGQSAGFALFFCYYSTWRGPGFYLEDLFVRPGFRGLGIGTQLFARVASIAQQENRTFIKWSVLDWNQPAIDMYKSLGAGFMDEWRSAMLEGEGLRNLAGKES